eukprot:CAMPEP_0179333660 /NCGR_PEP_ID=MMETSP0797-20121207/65475_1 /TAXON_ID=47934 /ORGANISM="Dinophysis acuminata, Strain DAEP01" /LENGTH=46 /DNA_ID= /DNA_START= /DNA_END= /DNA_ORIENTATION=
MVLQARHQARRLRTWNRKASLADEIREGGKKGGGTLARRSHGIWYE